MDEWRTVAKPPRRSKRPSASATSSQTVGDVKKFLSTWKTQECTNKLGHDWLQCAFFHKGGVDQRRNPYEIPYLPDEADLTGPEKAYHPLNFHTKFCEAFCRGAKCKYGEYCAFAHDELQQPSKYEEEMKQKLYPTKSRLQIKEFLPEMSEEVVQPPKILRSQLFEEAADSSRRVVCLPLTCLEVKVLQNPKMTLWKQIKDVELESMCQFQLKWNEMDAVTLQIQGPEQNVRDAQLEVERHLRPMRPKYDETKRKGYHARVIELLSNRLKTDGPEPFTDSKNSDLVSLRIDRQKEEVEVWSLNLPGVRKPQEVFGQIDWWVRDSRYDTLLTCEGCRDECTRDEGVTCSGEKPHFFCAECLERMLKSQLHALGAQKGSALCAICHQEVEDGDIAKSCGKEIWKEFQKAVIDAQVAANVQKMQQAFDERLQKKVEELMESYGNEEEQVKMQADQWAKEARNYALNLHCPHCKQVYSEFDGCMALECAHCHGHFCGYCHKALQSSRGAHDHVRECDANLTSNGSYYATADQIRDAQRRFRVKQLKKFFEEKKMKQRIRNATIIELGKDLEDLQVDPAALVLSLAICKASVGRFKPSCATLCRAFARRGRARAVPQVTHPPG
ncbi:Hypothetical protein SCF082_LOCUS30700 [Durusdinium trenchii]|uniref:C3H1-type domain-containing protein n=1 Tax=Durusdinium trenchii TaxID=1381693 RepID=A0ABP0N077_9DINO